MFTEQDLNYIAKKGASLETVNQHIALFKKGSLFLKVSKAATIGDGIYKYSENEIDALVHLYDENIINKQVVKFVPASGAASRMFKSLYSFLEIYSGERKNYEAFMNDNGLRSIMQLIQRLKDFAFYNDLDEIINAKGQNITQMASVMNYGGIIEAILFESGLNYGNLPKALLKFHKYGTISRTSLEEHLVEGANYAATKGEAFIHFTVSPEHKELFRQLIDKVLPLYEKAFNIRYKISFSEQKSSTDTIAVDVNNEPFRNSDNSLLFRPGGHGALIENLNEINADIIFIKNIDNVVPDRLKTETIRYKKAIGGLLLKIQDQIFKYTKQLGSSNDPSLAEDVKNFIEKELCTLLPASFQIMNAEEKKNILLKKLNRPVRVCGMVKNEGEPGGGPFWAENPDGSVSLQIVESSQINTADPQQNDILKNATHFNPVDLVCTVKDYQNNKFNLINFVDNSACFISKKSKDGKDLKALELPGLWNGAMSDWSTIFMEVPIITFNPVKTIDDLLRKEHQ